MNKPKRYSQMTAEELATVTAEFDDPHHEPPAMKPTGKQLAQLRRWQAKRAAQPATLSLSLEKELIEWADSYAADHGITFSELVADALRRLMQKKSA